MHTPLVPEPRIKPRVIAECGRTCPGTSLAETHAAGFLWAMIQLRSFFSEPLRTIALKAGVLCQVDPTGLDTIPWGEGISVAPPSGSRVSPAVEGEKARLVLNMLLSDLNAALRELENTESHHASEAKEQTEHHESHSVRHYHNQESVPCPITPHVVRY